MPGGTRHYDFGRALIKKGFEVTIFPSSFHYTLLQEMKTYGEKDVSIEQFEGVTFVWLKTFPYQRNDWRRVINMISYSFKAFRFAKDTKLNLGKPDIIIGSSVHLFAAWAAYLLSKYYRVPYVMEVRDLWPQTLIDMGIPKWHPFILVLRIIELFLYKKAKTIVTLLPKAGEYIESLGVDSQKIVWIPNGVDLERFKTGPSELFHGNNHLLFPFTVTYAGAIGRANNLEVVLEAAEILQKDFPKIKFLLVGDGPERSKLIRMASERRLSNVEFKSSVPKEDAASILFQSSLLFFNLRDSPVFKYGISSNKIFDYLASGKPILFACNAINNPVEDSKSGIKVSPNDPKEIAEAVIHLYRMPEKERREIGENGRKYIEKHYSINLLVDRFVNVIHEAMG
jgi:glycosyltransferase involved in cell wall biosynthesis